MASITYQQKKTLPVLEQILIAILAGCIIGTGLLIAFGLGVQVWLADRIAPGIKVSGIEVSGMTPQEAALILNEEISYPQEGRILLRDGEQTWLLSPAQLGMFIDPESTAGHAFEIGREGNLIVRLNDQWRTWRNGSNIAPIFVFDERIAYMQIKQIASLIDKPVLEAELSLNGAEVLVRSGQIGRTVNIDATIEKIALLLPTMRDGMVELVIEETPPYILDAEEQAALAKRILSKPLILTAEDAPDSPWQFDQNTLAENLRIERIIDADGNRYQVGINSDFLRSFLNELSPKLKINPKDAHYIFNDDTGELDVIESAIIGRELNLESTIQTIQEQIVTDNSHEIPLVFEVNKPFLTNDIKGSDLGITELVHEEISYFYGSSSDRVQNIIVASSQFHGVMIPPGATFSMADALGDITLENGYAEALIIAGGQTIQGVGGGVCQVSTTLFRAAFFAGFPIVERYPHAYRVSYYEKVAGNHIDQSLAGLDATVFVPIVDFKFTNDTTSWLLMETYVNPSYSSIVWKFYSTSDGREVNWSTSGVTNVIEAPEPKYIEKPDLNEGEIKQVDWAANGADVTVSRTVTRNGEVIISDTIFTRYRPWQAVYEYGPGTEIPDQSDDSED
jgi:vancomycin resistance protein YoaR